MKKFGLLLTLLMLSGCAFYALVPAGDVKVDDTYSFTITRDWNTNTQFGQVNLTLDGQSLQQVIATDGIADGKKLLTLPGKTLPTYKKSMSLLDIRDFLKDSVAGMGAEQIEETEFRPAKFGPWEGFRTEYTFADKDGLVKKMILAGMQHDEKLYVLLFGAPKMYYFDRHKSEVEQMLNSVKSIEKS